MKRIAKVIGRIIGILIDKGIIDREEALWILEPLKGKEFKENTNHISWSNLKNGTPIPPIEESRSDGSGIYRS